MRAANTPVGQIELGLITMSMPTPLDVVVIAERSDIAGIAAAILRGEDIGGYNPTISAACVKLSTANSPFFATSDGRKIKLDTAVSYLILDVRRVDVWLALDSTAAEDARAYVRNNGPAPKNFYRGVFPDPVVPCGFDIPYMPPTQQRFDEWLNSLVEYLKPWRDRIWDIYRDSS